MAAVSVSDALGALAALKKQLDDANAVGERAEEVKQYIDMFQVTVAMIPKRNSKGSIVKAKDEEEEPMSPFMKELTFLLPPDTVDKMNQFKKAAKMAKEAATSMMSSPEADPNAPKYEIAEDKKKKAGFFSCLTKRLQEADVEEDPSSGQLLLDMKKSPEMTDLEISYIGISFLVQTCFDEIDSAVKLVVEIGKNKPNMTWIFLPWKFQAQIARGVELDGHTEKIKSMINVLQTAISVASYTVSLEQLDNTMNASNAIEDLSFKEFWRTRIGTTYSRVPVTLFTDTFMTVRQKKLIDYHQNDMKYWYEVIEDSPETPDMLYKRFMLSKFKLPAGFDTISVFDINRYKPELKGDTKATDQLFEDLKVLEKGFNRAIRLEIMEFDQNIKKIKINKGLKFDGVYKINPFQRIYVSCTAAKFKDEVSSYDCFTVMKYEDDDLEGAELAPVVLEEKRRYRLYLKSSTTDPFEDSKDVADEVPVPVTLPVLSPKPPGFSSTDNYSNILKNTKSDNADYEYREKHWLHYKYSEKLYKGYIDRYQRMLYCPVLYDPGLYTVRYCLDDLQVNNETSAAHIKNMAMKSTKCYYYNRAIPNSGAKILSHLAALTGPKHKGDFGDELKQKAFIDIFLSYLKEVELKDANWIEDKMESSIQVERLMGLRDMIKPPSSDPKPADSSTSKARLKAKQKESTPIAIKSRSANDSFEFVVKRYKFSKNIELSADVDIKSFIVITSLQDRVRDIVDELRTLLSYNRITDVDASELIHPRVEALRVITSSSEEYLDKILILHGYHVQLAKMIESSKNGKIIADINTTLGTLLLEANFELMKEQSDVAGDGAKAVKIDIDMSQPDNVESFLRKKVESMHGILDAKCDLILALTSTQKELVKSNFDSSKFQFVRKQVESYSKLIKDQEKEIMQAGKDLISNNTVLYTALQDTRSLLIKLETDTKVSITTKKKLLALKLISGNEEIDAANEVLVKLGNLLSDYEILMKAFDNEKVKLLSETKTSEKAKNLYDSNHELGVKAADIKKNLLLKTTLVHTFFSMKSKIDETGIMEGFTELSKQMTETANIVQKQVDMSKTSLESNSVLIDALLETISNLGKAQDETRKGMAQIESDPKFKNPKKQKEKDKLIGNFLDLNAFLVRSQLDIKAQLWKAQPRTAQLASMVRMLKNYRKKLRGVSDSNAEKFNEEKDDDRKKKVRSDAELQNYVVNYYRGIQIELLKYCYFFAIRDFINEMSENLANLMKQSTSIYEGNIPDSRRADIMEEWKARKIALDLLNDFEEYLLPDGVGQAYRLSHVDFKTVAMLIPEKSKAYVDGKKLFFKPKNAKPDEDPGEQYLELLRGIVEVELAESLEYRKFSRAIELYELKRQLGHSKAEEAEEQLKKKKKRAADAETSEAEVSTPIQDIETRSDTSSRLPNATSMGKITKKLTREEISYHAEKYVAMLRTCVAKLQRDIELNFAKKETADRGIKLRRIDDCRVLIDLMKRIATAADLEVPKFYPFQIQCHWQSKKRCPLGVLIEVEKDFAMAWGDGMPLSDNLDLNHYLAKNHVRLETEYPYAVAKELRVSITDNEQPWKYIVLVATGSEKEEMKLSIQKLDGSETLFKTEVVGTDFLRYSIVDISSLFDQIHKVPGVASTVVHVDPKAQGNTNKLQRQKTDPKSEISSPRLTLATPRPADENEVPASEAIRLFRRLKALREIQKNLKIKGSLIEKLKVDIDDCLAWKYSVRATIREFVKYQLSVIKLIQKHNPSWESVDKLQKKGKEMDDQIEIISAMQEDLESSYYDKEENYAYQEYFNGSLEGVMVLTKRIIEYVKLARIQHKYLYEAKISPDVITSSVADLDDVIKQYDKTLADISEPPAQLLVLTRDIFLRNPSDDKDNDDKKKSDHHDDDESDTPRKKQKNHRKDQLTRIFEKVAIVLGDIKKEFDSFDSKYKDMKSEETSNELIKTFFENAESDDNLKFRYDGSGYDSKVIQEVKQRKAAEKLAIAKRNGELIEDDTSAPALSREASRKDLGDMKDNDESDTSESDYDYFDSDSSDEFGVESTDEEKVIAVEVQEDPNVQRFSSTPSDDEAAKVIQEDEEGKGAYMKMYTDVNKFINRFLQYEAVKDKPNKFKSFWSKPTKEFISEYMDFYDEEETEPKFPIDEYCEEYQVILNLLEDFLNDLSEEVYKLTTFNVQLMTNKNKPINNIFLTVKFVDDKDLYENIEIEDVDDDADNDDEKQDMEFYEEDDDVEEEATTMQIDEKVDLDAIEALAD